MMNNKMLFKLFHGGVMVLNCFTLWYDYSYVDLPFPDEDMVLLPFKARSMFLTIWCLVLQTLYFAVALLNDFFGTNDSLLKKTPPIRAMKDAMFCIAFPMATFVSGVFWTLYLMNREFVFPKILDNSIPPWVNHVMHSGVFIFIIIELVMCSRKYLSNKLGVAILLLISVVYKLWMYSLYLKTGIWVYPFLNVLSWFQMCIFFGLNFGLVVIVWYRCRKFNNFIDSLKYNMKNK